jgi:hypothetical protein
MFILIIRWHNFVGAKMNTESDGSYQRRNEKDQNFFETNISGSNKETKNLKSSEFLGQQTPCNSCDSTKMNYEN